MKSKGYVNEGHEDATGVIHKVIKCQQKINILLMYLIEISGFLVCRNEN
jgi:hypothetical protein